MGSEPVNEYALDDRTMFERFMGRLFPARRCPRIGDMEGFCESYMRTDIVVCLSWPDRIRLLFSGLLRVETATKTDVPVERTHSESSAYVLWQRPNAE